MSIPRCCSSAVAFYIENSNDLNTLPRLVYSLLDIEICAYWGFVIWDLQLPMIIRKSDKIDHAVGFVLPVKIGDRVEEGDIIGVIHANDQAKLERAQEEILAAITISIAAVDRLPHFYGVVE